MRKLISLGLLALLLSLFSSQLLAGEEECEILKDGDYTPGLYGLCIAWHNAGNDNARDRIVGNYEKKAGPDDPPTLPLEDDTVPCPCWDATHLAEADDGVPYSCLANGTDSGVEFALFDDPDVLPDEDNAYQFHIQDEF